MELNLTGYRLKPVECASAAEVMERAARSRAFRASFRPKPIVFSPQIAPSEPEPPPAPVVVYPEWPRIQFNAQCLNDYANRAGDYPNPKRGKIGPSIDAIQRAVCRHFLLSKKDLISARRDKGVCLPRHVAVWIIRKCTSRSYPEIGRAFGGRDHTTGINSFDKIERLRAAGDPVVAAALRAIGERLSLYIPA